MLFKNSVKILLSNFNIVWKMALYFIVVFALCIAGLYFLISPILEIIGEAGFFSQIIDLYSDFLSNLNLTEALETLSQILDNLFAFVVENISQLWFYFIGIAILIFFINFILFNLSNMASCMSLHLYIGSMTKQSFFASFSENFGKNLKFQLCNFLVTFPFNFLYVGLFVLTLKLFGISFFLDIIALLVIVVGLVALIALKNSIFVAWLPSMVVMNYGVFKSLKLGIKTVFKRFGRVFGCMVGYVITILVLNLSVGLFTLMTGLIISIPISFLLYNVIGMVVIYEGQGMRYYVDVYNVVTPQKKEITDKLKDMKYIV